MSEAPFKILFLCTGNSARSIMAEFMLRGLAPARFYVYSAGASPTGKINPLALTTLKERFHIDASSARSKSWEEFKDVKFDFVITVCDRARESCPVWPGQPVIAHWGSEDPAASQGSPEEKARAFKRVALEINQRVLLFCALPLEKLDRLRLERMTRAIGTRTEPRAQENSPPISRSRSSRH